MFSMVTWSNGETVGETFTGYMDAPPLSCHDCLHYPILPVVSRKRKLLKSVNNGESASQREYIIMINPPVK